MLQTGSFVGEYRIECHLGRGGMGEVYGAVHPTIGKRAAVKVLRLDVCQEPDSIERFVLEARAVNQIGHPNIVDIFAFGTLPDGRQYMVMEWLRGESLDARIKRGKVDIDEACDILLGVCAALAATHHGGIVHRDLKPANIFLVDVHGGPPLVKLLDFGLVKLTGSDAERIAKTRTGSLLGTPAYLSPEQARGVAVDTRADLYSLGVVAFELLTNQRPFPVGTAIELLVAHLQARPPAPSTIRQGIPVHLDALILALLAKEPDERPSLYPVRRALTQIRTGAPAPVHAVELVSSPRSVPLLLALAGAVLLGCIVFAAVRHVV